MTRAALAMPALEQTPMRADSDHRRLFPNSGLCGHQCGLGRWCRSTPLTHSSTHPPTHSFPPPLPARGSDSFFLLNCIKNDAQPSCLSPHRITPLPAHIRALRSTPRVPMKTTPDGQTEKLRRRPPRPASRALLPGTYLGPFCTLGLAGGQASEALPHACRPFSPVQLPPGTGCGFCCHAPQAQLPEKLLLDPGPGSGGLDVAAPPPLRDRQWMRALP